MPHYRRAWRIVAVIGGLAMSASAMAQNAVSLQFDNDGMVSGDDDQYTAGLEASWTQALDETHWSQGLVRWLPSAVLGEADTLTWQLSHRMYTPEAIWRRDLVADDRPYAGLALATLALHETRRGDGRMRASTVQVDTGMVGQSTRAESLQREVHRVTNSETPRGWRHQIGDEFVLNAGYRSQWWFDLPSQGLEWQHGPTLAAGLGNLTTHAGGGYALRFGRGLERGHGMPTLGPGLGGYRQASHGSGFGWYVYAGLEGRYVAHNLLLDGNTSKDSHSVDAKDWVGDAVLGLALTWDEWQLGAAYIARSEEFHGQDSFAPHGALIFSYHL